MTETEPPIERFRRKPSVTAMIRWDGTDQARRLIAGHSGKPVPEDTRQGALSIWVQKSAAWLWLPPGDWAALEADGTGVYPLADDEVREAYEPEDVPALTATERDRLAELENAIGWNTSCTSCARVLDSSIRETERAERAEEKLAAIRRGIGPATVFYAEAAASDLAQELAERAESHATVTEDAGTGNARGDDGRGAQNRAEGRVGDAP